MSLKSKISHFHTGSASNGKAGLALFCAALAHSFEKKEASLLTALVLGKCSSADHRIFKALLSKVAPGSKVRETKNGAKTVHITLRPAVVEGSNSSGAGIDWAAFDELRAHIAAGESMRGAAITAWLKGEKAEPPAKTAQQLAEALLKACEKNDVPLHHVITAAQELAKQAA